MKIGIDFDGLLSDCGLLKSEAALELYGVEIHPHQFKRELVVGRGLLTHDQYRELQYKIYGTRPLGFSMKPVPGAFVYIRQLLRDGHDLLVVTSRSGEQLAIAEEWTNDLGLDLPFVGVGYGKSKAQAARGLDVFIDDDLDKLEPLVGVVPHRFLFSWGYNKHLSEGAVASRVASWQEFYAKVAALG